MPTETPVKSTLNTGVPGVMSMVSSSSYTISTNSASAMRPSISDVPLNMDPDPSGAYPHQLQQPPMFKSKFRQKRLLTEPPALDNIGGSYLEGIGPSPIASPKSPPNIFDSNELGGPGGPLAHSTLQVPKSPRTPRSMGHQIRHRFTKTFKPGKCDLCSDYMFNGKWIRFDENWSRSFNFL